ncbi:MAG: GPW/gp25 family protein [Marinilabiliaceae bacterium]|nr:GPW/gp25 family protein [Marinilabiliaceae bacterium]
METTHYKLPLRIEKLFNEQGGHLQQCTLLESIDQHLELLLTTCPGEHAFDPLFGTQIWEMDFEQMASRARWEEQFADYIHKAVTDYEKRLHQVHVKIKIKDVLHQNNLIKSVAIRKRVEIYILGFLIHTGQRCGFNYTLYLGPLSSE